MPYKDPAAANARRRERYATDPEYREKRLAPRRARLRQRIEELDAIKLARGCEECGYREHPAALIFHHHDPDAKTINVSTLAGRQWEHIEGEMAKCAVLCANCHSIHHYSKEQTQ